ncbi:probable alpha-glucosidase Os06g0675700 [Selaginella moellendorffii]|uniref:probable alpha-glucosidase Os06g0675700 n=1 Tax=Selaginella moellendorffii TaxID=88036 RepID=UPI000D1C62AC|nr:probable alpha-glucosidase Os06g0675700 [Selaginella moellendorffii]|eukprot:XP_024517857.1 probable alpha-glucosidase Os06g0675700 [Selaginella moellendorffii]
MRKAMALSSSIALCLALWMIAAVSREYRVLSVIEQANAGGGSAILVEIADRIDDFGPDIGRLLISVSYETDERLHLMITDADSPRWEIPFQLIPRSMDGNSSSARFSQEVRKITSPKLQLSYTVNPFSFTVTRVSNGEILFDSPSSSSFVFKDQYLEISTRIPAQAALYGLGESTRSDGFRILPNSTYTLWAADTGADNTDVNLYGSHPFYMDVRSGGQAYGVLLLNSNGMDVNYEGEFLTYKVLGGVFDFYFFAGPSPLSVVQQYTALVGKPAAMPYWSLGFHQCRWGYKNVSQVEHVVAEYKKANLPLEVMWNDIDHMDVYKDFTLDPVNYPAEQLRAFVEKLHKNGQRYVLIVDPGLKPEKNYETYRRAKEMDVFIKDVQGKPYLGQVWPGPVHFPDFLHPRALEFWTGEVSRFHKEVPFDGLWIDMNEASNFCQGVTCTLPANVTCPIPGSFTQCCLVCSNDLATKWDNPPYAINNAGTHRSLGGKTIPTSATHYNGTLEYNAHNLYGLAEAIVINSALKTVVKKRPFVLSRSTFAGSGRVTAHWLGDNRASWNDLKYSISGILGAGLAGIPMVGADICGFSGNTTEELCNRWIQLGAFYPFSRDHNDFFSSPQELFVWKSVTRSARKALELRYKLLPYLYTLSFEAHTLGSPVARPLFFTFPNDRATLDIDKQFLLGRGVLISPVLTPNATTVKAYFPQGTWYSLFDYTKYVTSPSGSYQQLDAPWDTINVHVHEGSIIPMQEFALTTRLARKTPFTLVVAFSSTDSENSTASGELFLDDDDALEMKLAEGKSSFIKFAASSSGSSGGKVLVKASVAHGDFVKRQSLELHRVVVLGGRQSTSQPRKVLVNGKNPSESVTAKVFQTGVEISGLSLPLGSDFQLSLEL